VQYFYVPVTWQFFFSFSKVRLGVFDRDISEHTYEVNIDRNISHPQFTKSDMGNYNIALLRMAEEVEFSGN